MISYCSRHAHLRGRGDARGVPQNQAVVTSRAISRQIGIELSSYACCAASATAPMGNIPKRA